MKRALSMILTAAMAVLLFSGCGKQDTDADNGISTITIWHDKEDAVTEVLQKKAGDTGTSDTCGAGKEK